MQKMLIIKVSYKGGFTDWNHGAALAVDDLV